MRILVVSDGLDTVMTMTFAGLAERYGHEVRVIGPGWGGRKMGGVECVESQCIKSKFSPGAIRDIRRAIHRYGTDLIYAPSTSGLSNALFASFGTGVRVVGYRGTQHRIHRTDPTNYMALLNPRVSHVVCETPDIESYLSRFIPASKLSGRSKPYQTEWVAEALSNPLPSPLQSGRIRCIFIGSSKGRPFKGLAYLIEAMRMLEPEGVTLTVIGSVDESDMKTAPENVAFTGLRRDAINFLPSHHMLVLPSLRDASPRVVREAQACGVACVVTDIPGARDLIIPGETGVLVPPGDARAIASAILAIGNEPGKAEAMGKAGRRNIEQNYGIGPYIDYFDRLFRNLCGK